MQELSREITRFWKADNFIHLPIDIATFLRIRRARISVPIITFFFVMFNSVCCGAPGRTTASQIQLLGSFLTLGTAINQNHNQTSHIKCSQCMHSTELGGLLWVTPRKPFHNLSKQARGCDRIPSTFPIWSSSNPTATKKHAALQYKLIHQINSQSWKSLLL